MLIYLFYMKLFFGFIEFSIIFANKNFMFEIL